MIRAFLISLKDNGMTQQQIADRAGITQAMISKYINGRPCTVEILIRIAKAFNVSTDTVLGISDDRRRGDNNHHEGPERRQRASA